MDNVFLGDHQAWNFGLNAESLETAWSASRLPILGGFLHVTVRLGQRGRLTRSFALGRDGVPFPFQHKALLPSTQVVFLDYTWWCRCQLLPGGELDPFMQQFWLWELVMEGSQLLIRWTILCCVASRCAAFDAVVIRHLQTVSSVLLFILFPFLRHAKLNSRAPFHFHHIHCKGTHSTNKTLAYCVDLFIYLHGELKKSQHGYNAFC